MLPAAPLEAKSRPAAPKAKSDELAQVDPNQVFFKRMFDEDFLIPNTPQLIRDLTKAQAINIHYFKTKKDFPVGQWLSVSIYFVLRRMLNQTEATQKVIIQFAVKELIRQLQIMYRLNYPTDKIDRTSEWEKCEKRLTRVFKLSYNEKIIKNRIVFDWFYRAVYLQKYFMNVKIFGFQFLRNAYIKEAFGTIKKPEEMKEAMTRSRNVYQDLSAQCKRIYAETTNYDYAPTSSLRWLIWLFVCFVGAILIIDHIRNPYLKLILMLLPVSKMLDESFSRVLNDKQVKYFEKVGKERKEEIEGDPLYGLKKNASLCDVGFMVICKQVDTIQFKMDKKIVDRSKSRLKDEDCDDEEGLRLSLPDINIPGLQLKDTPPIDLYAASRAQQAERDKTRADKDKAAADRETARRGSRPWRKKPDTPVPPKDVSAPAPIEAPIDLSNKFDYQAVYNSSDLKGSTMFLVRDDDVKNRRFILLDPKLELEFKKDPIVWQNFKDVAKNGNTKNLEQMHTDMEDPGTGKKIPCWELRTGLSKKRLLGALLENLIDSTGRPYSVFVFNTKTTKPGKSDKTLIPSAFKRPLCRSMPIVASDHSLASGTPPLSSSDLERRGPALGEECVQTSIANTDEAVDAKAYTEVKKSVPDSVAQRLAAVGATSAPKPPAAAASAPAAASPPTKRYRGP